MAGLKSLELASATGGTEARVVTSSAWKDLGKSSNWMVDHPGSYQFMIRCDLKTCWIKVSKKLIFWPSLIVNYPLMVKICVIYIGERSTAVDFLEWRGVLRFFFPEQYSVSAIIFETIWYLVGGIPTPPKNMTSSVGMMKFPIKMESHNPFMFQTTNQICSSSDVHKSAARNDRNLKHGTPCHPHSQKAGADFPIRHTQIPWLLVLSCYISKHYAHCIPIYHYYLPQVRTSKQICK